MGFSTASDWLQAIFHVEKFDKGGKLFDKGGKLFDKGAEKVRQGCGKVRRRYNDTICM